jgi:hypothetical protein
VDQEIDPKTGLPVEYDPSKAVQAYNDYPKGGTPRQNVGVMGTTARPGVAEHRHGAQYARPRSPYGLRDRQ